MAYTGSGTSADPYLVGTIDDLASAMGQADTVYIKMTADLDWTGRSNIQCRTPNANSSRIYIDGDGTSWTNIALINCTMFFDTRSGVTSDTKVIKFSNLTIEAMWIWNNSTAVVNNISSEKTKNFFMCGPACSVMFTDCNVYLKMYYIIFSTNPGGQYMMGHCFSYKYSSGVSPHSENHDIMLRTNFVVDFYNIGRNGGLLLYTGWSSLSVDHYIRDSVIKISYYDENGWGTTGDQGNFNTTDNPGRAGWCYPIFGGEYDWSYNSATIVNSAVFLRYYAETNINSKVTVNFVQALNVVNSYFIFEAMGSIYLKPRFAQLKFNTYGFYDIDKAPTIVTQDNDYAYGSSQFAGLTTAQCKSRSSFEGPDAIIPFKLKQTT